MAGRGKDQKQGLLADVNERVHELAQHSAYEGVDVWEFFCECCVDGCHDSVEVSLAEYEELKHAGKPILARGHQPSRSGRTRAKTRHLLEEAKALRAQAHHQLGRARGAMRDSDDLLADLMNTAPLAFRCLECGYGVAVKKAPERCPMCGRSDWQQTR